MVSMEFSEVKLHLNFCNPFYCFLLHCKISYLCFRCLQNVNDFHVKKKTDEVAYEYYFFRCCLYCVTEEFADERKLADTRSIAK